MAGILDYFSQLFGQGQPAPAGAAAPTPAAPAQDPQQPQGMLAGYSPDQVQALIAKARPGALGTLLGAFGRSGSFDQVRDQITKENLAREMLPQTIALQQQGIRYGQSIQDPALRELYFNDRPAYSDIEKQRLGQTKVGQNETVYGAGPNGDQTFNGTVISKQGDTVGNTAGNVVQHNKAAPIVLGPSQSAADGETAGIISTAPAAPQVVTTNTGQGVHVVDPNGGGAGAPAPAPAAGGPPVAGSQVPRGIRNNNPWNLTNLGKGTWQGQVGRDGDMAVFSTPEEGAAAADRNLIAKYSLHGLNTVQGIIADPKWGWDPGNQAYVQTVSADLKVPPNQPLNLQDPSVRGALLNSMKKVEVGKFAAQAPNAPGAAPAPGQPAPAQADGHGTVRTVVSPTPVRQATPQEAIAAGKPPGAWEISPDGSWKMTAQPNKDELARVNGMVQAAQALEDVTSLDKQFLNINKRSATGLQYAGGHFNPITHIAEAVNPEVGTMEDLANRETLAFRPQGVGRILQAEIPMFRASALDPGRTYGVNQSIAQEHAETAALLRAKANFYQDWLYNHGNLGGADQGWAQQEARQQRSAPQPSPRAASRAPKQTAQPKGWKINVVQQ